MVLQFLLIEIFFAFNLLLFLEFTDILGDLVREEHFANSFDGYLTKLLIRKEHVLLEDHLLKLLSLLIGAVEYQSIDRSFQS